jgi:hypothetical protein
MVGSSSHDEFSRYLDTNRDGTGSVDMNATAATYGIKPDVGEIYVIDSVRIAITDASPLDADGFGGLAALATGCLLEIREKPGDSDEQAIASLSQGSPIHSHAQLVAVGPTELYSGAADCIVQTEVALAAPIHLDGSRGESLVFQTQDDVSGLTGLHVLAVGRVYRNP